MRIASELPEHRLAVCAPRGVGLRGKGDSGQHVRWAHRQNAYVPPASSHFGSGTYCSMRRKRNAAPRKVITAPTDMMIKSGA
jgi:hypothetical protein